MREWKIEELMNYCPCCKEINVLACEFCYEFSEDPNLTMEMKKEILKDDIAKKATWKDKK